jgi:hypothetical protein
LKFLADETTTKTMTRAKPAESAKKTRFVISTGGRNLSPLPITLHSWRSFDFPQDRLGARPSFSYFLNLSGGTNPCRSVFSEIVLGSRNWSK